MPPSCEARYAVKKSCVMNMVQSSQPKAWSMPARTTILKPTAIHDKTRKATLTASVALRSWLYISKSATVSSLPESIDLKPLESW